MSGKTKAAFIDENIDELSGLLLAAFHAAEPTVRPALNCQVAGEFFIRQLKRGKDLLGRMWDSMQPAEQPLPIKAPAAAPQPVSPATIPMRKA